MDFFTIRERSLKRGSVEVYPDFKVCRSQDLMVRGRSFYAIWNPDTGLWSTDEYDVQRLVDKELWEYAETLKDREDKVIIRSMGSFSSRAWIEFKNYLNRVSDNSHQLDNRLTFQNTEVKKEDYVSKRLPYSLQACDISAYEELMSTLYDEEERRKIEWAIGSIVEGDSKDIQKFVVLYGEGGTGKSTVLKIIQQLFDGYYTTFEAKALASSSNAFSTEVFKTNPLVAIQHDGDLSKIEDNTKLNSIIAHEQMTMNEKYKPSYSAKTNCFLFMGSNRPVKITDAKSGIIRRLIDVHPSGRLLPPAKYFAIMDQISFELGGIALRCRDVYRSMGKNYFASYRPVEMMLQTDVFFNFVESYFSLFKNEDGITLTRAYELYKTYCDEALVDFKLPRHKFREELKNYFRNFLPITRVNGKQVRSYYFGFIDDKFDVIKEGDMDEERANSLVLDQTHSALDEFLKTYPAQYANEAGKPMTPWDEVTTTLADLDTRMPHYVRGPSELITIDLDLKNESGEKDAILNLQAASKFPPTYAEYSYGGKGIHLCYIYDGDPFKLKSKYSDGIEIKVFKGLSAIRRRLSFCNALPIATISGGLPIKEAKPVTTEYIHTERSIRKLIEKNLRKEIMHATKPSMDFIKKILDDAYEAGIKYDVSDMKPTIFAFAAGSTNQRDYCVKLMRSMHFVGKNVSPIVNYYGEPEPEMGDTFDFAPDVQDVGGKKKPPDPNSYVFFDVEVFPNLALVVWKKAGVASKCVRMINPKPQEIEELLKFNLIGFNCRRYDNHILYAMYLGYTNAQIYDLSQKLIGNKFEGAFRQAYNLSYTDVWDFSSEKKSLKKFEIELGIHHKELGLPWDQPVDPEKWNLVAEYCENDVLATEAVFNSRQGDFKARMLLADLTGMTCNTKTNTLSAAFIFGNDKHPQAQFNYRNMGDMSSDGTYVYPFEDDEYTVFDQNGMPIFPGYKFENGVSTYRGEEIGEGGYVYGNPGVYWDVDVEDVRSMHPSSVIAENLFGDMYTARFKEIVDARIAVKNGIKTGDFEEAKKLLGGKLEPYLQDKSQAKDISHALKIVINSVYGLTAARFDNPFKDRRNVDNIVAKRGALFMVNLRHQVQSRGFTVAHIKTDSIKIPNATPEIIEFVREYGRMYGYVFEQESVYDRMFLKNDAVYIAKCADGHWSATGTQFAVPYVFKTLFSGEPVDYADMAEVRSCVSDEALYLDMNESLPEGEHNYVFVGKVGMFTPVTPGSGGGLLKAKAKNGTFKYVSASSGYRWLETEQLRMLGKFDRIDVGYYDALVDKAMQDIEKYCSYDAFIDGSARNDIPEDDNQKIDPDDYSGPTPANVPGGECFSCMKFLDGECGDCKKDTEKGDSAK